MGDIKGSPEIIEPESSEDEDEESLMSKTMATMMQRIEDPITDPDFLVADDPKQHSPNANFKVSEYPKGLWMADLIVSFTLVGTSPQPVLPHP